MKTKSATAARILTDRDRLRADLDAIAEAAVQVVHEYVDEDDLSSDAVSILKDRLVERGYLKRRRGGREA